MMPDESVSASSARGDPLHRSATSALILAIGLAWTAVVAGPRGMGAGLAVFVLTWTVMMAAMMLPSAAPLLLLYRRSASPSDTALVGAGYLLMWALTGVPAFFLHERFPMTVGPLALAAAGIYQLMPLKGACLTRCRTPADFLVQRWGRGPLSLGVEHGAWCVACCWALMVVLVAIGGMGLAWVVGVAALVAVEKLARRGATWARLSGVGLLAAAGVQAYLLWSGSPAGVPGHLH